MSLSYESSGVRYDQLDAFKRACQQAARKTSGELKAHGYAEPATTRGESAYLIEGKDHFLAHVEEGLGTKNLVADAVYKATGKNFYREIAIDTVATIVNDLVTCGARPISVAMHAAVGDSGWFADAPRMEALVEGWAEGCHRAGAVWGGGETPTLKGIVNADTIVLAGSAIGKIEPKAQRITGEVKDGDAIIFLASTGVQTNGLSPAESARLTRRITVLSVATATVLVSIKAVVWLMSGSVALLASLADSGLDLIASLVTFFAVRYAAAPPDDEHRYGHGKAEAFASLLQAGLVFASAALIGQEAIRHLMEPSRVQATGVGAPRSLITVTTASPMPSWRIT